MVQHTISLDKRMRFQNETSYAERRVAHSHNIARPAIQQTKVKGPPAAGSPVVMVLAKTKDVASYIRHPTGPGLSTDKPTAWPADRFTFRRLKEGVIVKQDAGK